MQLGENQSKVWFPIVDETTTKICASFMYAQMDRPEERSAVLHPVLSHELCSRVKTLHVQTITRPLAKMAVTITGQD